MSEQEMSAEQRQFEEAVINMAVVEHHRYCMTYKRAKSEKDAHMFYTAFKLGITKGMQYITKQVLDHNKKIEEKENETRTKK